MERLRLALEYAKLKVLPLQQSTEDRSRIKRAALVMGISNRDCGCDHVAHSHSSLYKIDLEQDGAKCIEDGEELDVIVGASAICGKSEKSGEAL